MKSIKFEPEELTRYQRHLVLPEIGYDGQVKLKQSSVLVIGAGGLGCPALLYLASSGIGKIGIVDFDKVDISNLQRQILYQSDDIGKPKARIAKIRLQKLNPYTEFIEYQTKLVPDNSKNIFEPYDIIIDGTDNFETRYLINDTAVVLGKPFVYGAISRFEGQLSVFNYKDGPTLRCLFPEKEGSNSIPSCEVNGVMGILPGMIGSMQATETIKMIAGIGEVASGKLVTYDALTNTMISFAIKANPDNKNISIKDKY